MPPWCLFPWFNRWRFLALSDRSVGPSAELLVLSPGQVDRSTESTLNSRAERLFSAGWSLNPQLTVSGQRAILIVTMEPRAGLHLKLFCVYAMPLQWFSCRFVSLVKLVKLLSNLHASLWPQPNCNPPASCVWWSYRSSVTYIGWHIYVCLHLHLSVNGIKISGSCYLKQQALLISSAPLQAKINSRILPLHSCLLKASNCQSFTCCLCSR